MDISISNGVRGQALQQYLSGVHFDLEADKQSLLKAMDKNSKDGIDEVEAAQALPFLKAHNLDNVKVLTQAEVNKMIRAMSFTQLSDLGPVWPIPNTPFEMVVLTKSGAQKLGIDLEQVFALCPENKTYHAYEDDDYLRKLDFYQTNVLLNEIDEVNPEIGVGLPNAKLADEVVKVLNENSAAFKNVLSFSTARPPHRSWCLKRLLRGSS